MGLVSESQLNALRVVAYQGLETEMTILRAEQVENDFGSQEAWVDMGSHLGWIREMSTSKVGEIAGFLGTTGTFRVHMEVDVDLRPGDRIGIDGLLFDVSDTNSDNTIRVWITAICRRVE